MNTEERNRNSFNEFQGKLREHYAKEGIDDWDKWILGFEQYTCHDCRIADVCEYAWDSYNTDFECLASK